MAKRKPKAIQDTDELIDSSIREAAAAHPRPPKPKGERKSGGGRPATVDYERNRRINVCVTDETFDQLSKAVAIESGKRYPSKIDKGLIIEEALTAWFKKNKIT